MLLTTVQEYSPTASSKGRRTVSMLKYVEDFLSMSFCSDMYSSLVLVSMVCPLNIQITLVGGVPKEVQVIFRTLRLKSLFTLSMTGGTSTVSYKKSNSEKSSF